jgi:hypothetical protein
MIIVAGGDSFIHGSELKDQTPTIFSKFTIPALLAKSVSADYVCVAEPGNANNAIARQVMNACEQYKGQSLFVFVMWSFTHRYEFRFNYDTGRRTSPWYSLNLWDIVDNVASLKKHFHTFDPVVFDDHVNNKKILNNSGLTEFVKTFYKHVGNSEFYENYTSYKEILFLQQYLKLNNIPYMFTSADLDFQSSLNYQRHKNDVNMYTLYNQIDWGNWFSFAPGVGNNQTEMPRGFYQWAVESNYPLGTTHPLEQAHADAANLMQGKFNELVKKSIQ